MAQLWDVATGTLVRRFIGHRGGVFCVALSPDGRYLATGSNDKSARVWDVVTGREIRQLGGHASIVQCVAWSPDGDKVLTTSWDYSAQVWDTGRWQPMCRLVGHGWYVFSGTFSPDGRLVITGSWDGTTRLWDAATGKYLCGMAAARDGSWAVFTEDGRFDSSHEGQVPWLHWRSGDRQAPLATFRKEAYTPGLLRRIVSGERLRPPMLDRTRIP